MKTLKPTQAWILICFMTAVSSGTTEHAPAHHDASQHGDSTAQTRSLNTIIPFGIQIPEHVLSKEDVACISTDDNIFQIMDDAQKTCKGSDMKCTFYHFINHGYQNIGTLDVNKELFDDLLMKFDNWLLTAENIDENDVHGKTKGISSDDTASVHVNDGKVANSFNTYIKANGLNTIQGKVDHNISESGDDRIHGHLIRNPDETHTKNHHHKWKNGNHIKLDTEYNNEHRYFEVFLPKDKETGKSRTIYVEIDRDKNEFVLLDEDIDKKLNGIKPIRIELDELSEIADTAFSDIVKSSKHKGHIHNNLDDDDRVMTSDLNTNSAVDDHEIPLDTDADERTQNILNSSVCNPNICNINANQQLISDNTPGYVKKVINVSKNLIVPDKYINQAQFHVESHINNTENMITNNNFEILQHTNEAGIHEPDYYDKELLNIIEFDHSNTTKLDIINEKNSPPEFIEIPCDYEHSNGTENDEISIDHENIPYDDNDFIQLVEKNDTNDDINVDDGHDFASSETVYLKDLILQGKKNKLKSTPDIYVNPKSTTYVTTGMSDHIGSQLHLIPSVNREGHADLDTHSLVSSMPIPSYTTVPILDKDLAKVVEIDSNLQSSDFDRMPSTTPLSVMPISPKEAVSSPYPYQPIQPYLQPTKDNFGFINSPFDNNFKDTMIPCLGNRNRYPCNTIPYFLNPYIKPPQFIPPYFDPQLPVTPLQPISKFPTFDSSPISLDQNNPGLNSDTPQGTKPMPLFPFAPNTPFSPLNPMWLGSSFIPNTCPSLWNNIPYQTMPSLPYSVLPAQNMWNYSPTPNNYLAPTMELQQSQFLKPLPAKEAAKSHLEDSYPTKNILQMTPLLTYAPTSSVHPRPVQIDLNPSFSLERDLQTLSCKYGIPLTKILDYLESEMSGTHSKTCSSPFELPCSILEHDGSFKGKTTSLARNAGINVENRSGNEEILLESDLTNLTVLDSSLIGPHLDMDNIPILGANDYQTSTVASETGILNAHSSLKNQPKQIILDNSLIGPHLSTLSTSNFQLNDEDRIGNAELHLESDSSSLIPLDSSLIGPHLEIRPSVELDSNISQGSIITSHIEVPGTKSSSQTKTILNTQNQPTIVPLESSLQGPHLPTLSKAKSLLSEEIQSINILESDPTELKPLDSSQVDSVNELTEILQPEKTAVTLSASTDSTKSFKLVETEPSLIEEEVLHLDSSLIGPHLQTGSSSIHNSSTEQKTVPEISQASLQNASELESIILPPSMLPTLLKKAVTADFKRNIHIQDAQLNGEHNELSLGTNVELPITDISSVTPSLEETDFQILEHTLVQPKNVKNKLTSPGIKHTVDSDMQLHGSLLKDSIPFHQIETQEMSSNLDSSIQLDNSLIGPSILQEIDSQEISPMLDSIDHLKSSIGATFANQNKKPLTVSAAIDSEIEHDSSLTGPTLHKEIKSHGSSASSNFVSHLENEMETIDESTAFDSKNILDSSLVGPHLSTARFSTDEIKIINKELQLKSDPDTLLDSSLIGSHLDFEGLDKSEISRYQNPELSGFVDRESSLQSNAVPSEVQELMSKFTNAITKSHLSPSEIKPCDKLLSSIGKISSDTKPIPCEDLQTYTQLSSQDEVTSEFFPIPLSVLEQNLSPLKSVATGQPCINSNYFPTPVTFPQYAYAKEAPQIPVTPYSPFVQMKPLIHHNLQGPSLNIHPGLRPVAENAQIPFISNALEPLSSEEFKLLLDLASQNNLFPQLSNPNIFGQVEPLAPSSEWTIPPQILTADKYIPLLPKKSSIVLPSNLQPTVCNTEYNPVEVDDIISLLNENSHHIHKNTPYSQSFVPPSISEFERGDILSPSLFDYVTTRPVLPDYLANAIVPLTFYNPHLGMYNPQNIPYMEQTPYTSPYNLQAFSNLPEDSKFSEVIGPAPKLVSIPTQLPNVFLESQFHDISNTPQFIESNANPILEKDYLQQLLSKPCIDSPIILPNSALKAMLQLPAASNELNVLHNTPCQSPPISPFYSTPISNAFTSLLSPSYTSPLSVPYAKAISKPNTSLPLDLSYTASPITSPALLTNPYTTSPCLPEFSSPLLPVRKESTNYTYLPTVAQNSPIPSAVPYKPCHTYSSPYLPVQPSPMPFQTSPYSPFITTVTPDFITLPVYSQPISASYFRPASKSFNNLGLPAYSEPVTPVSIPRAPTQAGVLSPIYLSLDPSFSYTTLPDTSTQKRPSNCLSSAYLNAISQESPNVPLNIKYLPSNPIFSPISQITNQELQLLRPISTLPITCENNPFLNSNQMLPISPNIPIPSYSTLAPKLSPSSNSLINQTIIPCGDVILSNLQTSPLTEEEPFYDVIEENMFTHSNDREKFDQEPTFNYPLESMSYTLAPEEMTEILPGEDFIIQEDLVMPAPIKSLAAVPSLQANLYQRPGQTPYISLYGKPCSTQHFSPPLSLTELNQQYVYDNISLMPPSNPLNLPASQPISILTSPLLKPLTQVNPAPNPTILPYSCMDTSLNQNYILPLKKETFLSSPYYSITSQSIGTPPKVLKDITSPAFFQVPTNIPFTPVSPITLTQPPTSPVIPNVPQSFVKSSSIPNYNQYATPIMSHVQPKEETITPRYTTPLSLAQDFKIIKPAVLPAPITFQDTIPLRETPIHYQPFITPPTGVVSSANNVFLSPAVTSPYTESLTFNHVSEPLNIDLKKPKWSSFTPTYSLPAPLSLPVPVSRPTAPLSTCLPMTTSKQTLTNHIIPSSLFTIPDINLLTTTSPKKMSPRHNIPKYSLPSSVEPLEIFPYETLSSPSGNTVRPQTDLRPNRQFSNRQFNVPQSSLPYFTQPVQPTDSYSAQPINDQYNCKPHPKFSPVSTQYATSCFTPLPLETVPNRLINKPQYGLPSVPIYDTPIHSSSSGRNPFLNPNFKPIPEVTSYPVPNHLISSPKITPFDSILLSNLRPPDICQDPFEANSPVTSLPSLHSSSLLKPFLQRARQYEPEINPILTQYLSPIESIPQLLPSTSSLINHPLLKPLLTNSQNIAPLLPIHLSRLNTPFSETAPTNYLPSVTGTYQHPSPSTSLLSEIPETAQPLKLLPNTPYSLLKSRFNKLQQTPLTMANTPLYSNCVNVEPSPDLSKKANTVSVAKPIKVSALDASLLSRDSFDPEIIEEIESTPVSKYRSPLPMNLRQFYPAYTDIPKPSPKYKTSKPRPFSLPTLIPEDVELIDTTGFIPLSQVKSEPVIADYSSIDRQASIKNTPTTKPDISQFPPYTTVLNTEATSPTYMKLPPKLKAPSYSNQFPLFLSPREYEELIQGPSVSDGSSSSSSSSNFLTHTNTEPQLVSSELTGRPRPITLNNSPISIQTGSWLQSPTLARSLPLHEIPIEITPEKQSIETLLNKYRYFNKISPLEVNRYPYQLIPEVPLEQNIVKPHLIKSGPNTEYEDKYSNDFNEYDSENMPFDHELENISVDENRLGNIDAKSLDETLPEIVNSMNIPSSSEMTRRRQRLSKLDHFYANNYIGQGPQVFNVPTYKTLPADLKNPLTIISPELFKEFSNMPSKYFDTIPKLDTTSQMNPNAFYPVNDNSPKNVPITNSHPQTYLNPYLKPYSQRKYPPDAIEIADTSEIPDGPTSYARNNIDDIKYSGYKTYQIPSLKFPKSTQTLGTQTQINDPNAVTNTPPILAYKLSEVQQNPNNSYFYTPTEIYKLHNTQSQTLVDMTTPLQTKLRLDSIQESPEYNEYESLSLQLQTPVDMTTPLQTKLGLDALQESPEYDEYNPIEDIPISLSNINEDNELKTSLINYINNRGDVKNNLNNNDGELTIPIGNIAIIKKEPYNSETIETNNPSIGLKVWKSNVKIAQAEIKFKFKDLSVNNFMPVVNNLDKYDMEEIRKIVKNYIDERYGAHIEVNAPFTIDNKYSIIKDFDYSAVENKYNLLWPTHYI